MGNRQIQYLRLQRFVPSLPGCEIPSCLSEISAARGRREKNRARSWDKVGFKIQDSSSLPRKSRTYMSPIPSDTLARTGEDALLPRGAWPTWATADGPPNGWMTPDARKRWISYGETRTRKGDNNMENEKDKNKTPQTKDLERRSCSTRSAVLGQRAGATPFHWRTVSHIQGKTRRRARRALAAMGNGWSDGAAAARHQGSLSAGAARRHAYLSPTARGAVLQAEVPVQLVSLASCRLLAPANRRFPCPLTASRVPIWGHPSL
ncbi:unnamed protein product [Diplocarpon coronariae]